jgi:hypothetical protein
MFRIFYWFKPARSVKPCLWSWVEAQAGNQPLKEKEDSKRGLSREMVYSRIYVLN